MPVVWSHNLTLSFDYSATFWGSVLKYLIIVFLAFLVGCAANRQPAQSELRVSLAQPVTLEQVFGLGNRAFSEVRVVEVLAPVGTTYSSGSLWFMLQTAEGNRQWISANEIESWRPVSGDPNVVKSAADNVKLRNGQVILTRSMHPKWCPSASEQINSVQPNGCLTVLSFHGARAEGLEYTTLSSDNTRLFFYKPGGTNNSYAGFDAVKRVLIGPEVIEEKAKLLEANNQYRIQQRKQNEEATARASDRETQRLKRIQSAKSGTTDNCTSADLVARGEPVSSEIFIRCGTLGEARIRELKESGWDVQVLQRIPTAGKVYPADSVELAIRKR